MSNNKKIVKKTLKSKRKCSNLCRKNNGSFLYVPVGCRACGNPDYPACKDSCPLFDD